MNRSGLVDIQAYNKSRRKTNNKSFLLSKQQMNVVIVLAAFSAFFFLSFVAYFAAAPIVSMISSSDILLQETKDQRTVPVESPFLKIVSMNIAACEPSQSASFDWSQQRSVDAVRSEIIKNDPDIIALQESPGDATWAARIFPDYQALGAKYSHANQVVLLVRKGIVAQPIPTSRHLPAVVASLQLDKNDDRQILVASVHLEPFQQGSFERKNQMEALLQTASSVSAPLIVAGDTNMRKVEDNVMENELGLLDAWKLAGSPPDSKFTWDTIDHSSSGGSFNKYYGRSTRQYNARYDRIYISTRSTSLEIEREPLTTFELIANKPLTNNFHFLSDHFGIYSRLRFRWNT